MTTWRIIPQQDQHIHIPYSQFSLKRLTEYLMRTINSFIQRYLRYVRIWSAKISGESKIPPPFQRTGHIYFPLSPCLKCSTNSNSANKNQKVNISQHFFKNLHISMSHLLQTSKYKTDKTTFLKCYCILLDKSNIKRIDFQYNPMYICKYYVPSKCIWLLANLLGFSWSMMFEEVVLPLPLL